MRAFKALVVEDSVVSRMLLVDLLRSMGHQTVGAVNGREGIEAAMKDAFDVIFMDLRMPVMDGLSATKVIRRFGPSSPTSRNVPIIAVSSGSPGVSYGQCAEAGLNAFLCKPVDVQRLEQILRQVMPGENGGRLCDESVIAV